MKNKLSTVETKKTKKKNKLLLSVFSMFSLKVLLFLAIFTWFAISVISQEINFGKNRESLQQLDTKIAEQKDLQIELSKQKDEINTEEFKIKKARERGYIIPGEVIYADAQRAR